MTDRYERIRKGLAMGPTPGPWEWKEGQSIITREWDGKDWPIASVERSRLGWHENRRCESLEAGANAAHIAACDPDTIRELLAERDALAAEVERCHARLEIDRHYVPNEAGDDLIEKSIPMAERAEIIDGTETRDATIREQDEQLLALRKWRQEYVGKLTIAETALAEAKRENEALREALEEISDHLVNNDKGELVLSHAAEIARRALEGGE